MKEIRRSFECFGGQVAVSVLGPDPRESQRAVADAEARLLRAHRQLSRFLPGSGLSRLNGDPRATVPVEPLLLDLAEAAVRAGRLTGGVVDATLVGEIEAAGYRKSLGSRPGSGPEATPVPDPGPAAPSRARAWEAIVVDRAAGTVSRPSGLRIDSGGVAKGMLADQVADDLRHFPAFLVDCCGDVRIGGSAGLARPVLVEDPFGEEPIESLRILDGGIATSGITRRSWRGPDGGPAHHLLDPATGGPAFTGIVQATALAPTAFLADVLAKWALLSGPELAPSRLPHGGILVHADGEVETVLPAAEPSSDRAPSAEAGAAAPAGCAR